MLSLFKVKPRWALVALGADLSGEVGDGGSIRDLIDPYVRLMYPVRSHGLTTRDYFTDHTP